MKFDKNSTERFRTLLNGFAIGENAGLGPFFLVTKKKTRYKTAKEDAIDRAEKRRKKETLKRSIKGVELLLERGANPNIKGRWVREKIKSTPLMWAVKVGNIQLVKLLLKHGANPLLKDSIGNTLFDRLYIPKGINVRDKLQKTKKYRKIVKTIKIIPIQRRYRKHRRIKTAREVLLSPNQKIQLPEDVIRDITRKYLFNMNVPRRVPLRRQVAGRCKIGSGAEVRSPNRCDYRYLIENGKISPKNSVNKYCIELGYAKCDGPRKRKSRTRYCSENKFQ
jgi:hypothetical protein